MFALDQTIVLNFAQKCTQVLALQRDENGMSVF